MLKGMVGCRRWRERRERVRERQRERARERQRERAREKEGRREGKPTFRRGTPLWARLPPPEENRGPEVRMS